MDVAASLYNERDVIVGMGDISRVNNTPWLAAVYGDAEFNFTPSLVIHAGGRYDQYSTFGSALSLTRGDSTEHAS